MDTQSNRFTRDAAIAELERLGRWWLAHAPDECNGGFVGEIDADGRAVADASKGLVLNCRLLWFFSEMLRFTGQAGYAAAAERAYQYLAQRFEDRRYGGALWALSPRGQVISDRKQTYAQCFCIYALVAYYRATSDATALADAKRYLDVIAAHASDHNGGGLVEAFARDWSPIEDMRLGADDMNAPKTMNTHLHFVEAQSPYSILIIQIRLTYFTKTKTPTPIYGQPILQKHTILNGNSLQFGSSTPSFRNPLFTH